MTLSLFLQKHDHLASLSSDPPAIINDMANAAKPFIAIERFKVPEFQALEFKSFTSDLPSMAASYIYWRDSKAH